MVVASVTRMGPNGRPCANTMPQCEQLVMQAAFDHHVHSIRDDALGLVHQRQPLGDGGLPLVDDGLLEKPLVLLSVVVVDAVSGLQAEHRLHPSQKAVHDARRWPDRLAAVRSCLFVITAGRGGEREKVLWHAERKGFGTNR